MAGLAEKEMKSRKDKKTSIAAAIGYLFMSRDYIHKAHLKTPSYSTHIALNELYTDLLEYIDELAEVSQGILGKLDIPEYKIEGNVNDPILVLQKQVNTFMSMVDSCESRAINKIIDEIEAIYYRTLYKIVELS